MSKTTRRPDGRQGGTVVLFHATLTRRVLSILRRGLLTSQSKGARPAVWLHEPGHSEWAVLHTVRRHGGRVQDVVVLEVEVPRVLLKRHGAAEAGLLYTLESLPPSVVKRVIDFAELSASPVERGAA